MMSRLSPPHWFRFVVMLLLFTGISGCEKQPEGPAGAGGAKKAGQAAGLVKVSLPEAAPPVAIAMPAAPIPPDPGIFAFLRLRDPNQLIDRVGAWISVVNEQMNATMLRTQMQMFGVNLSEMRAGANLAAFVWEFAQGPMLSQPVVALLPIPPTGALAGKLKQTFGDAGMTAAGDNVLASQNAEALAKATALSDALVAFNQAQMPADLQLFINMDAIMKKYGVMLGQQMEMIKGMMAMATAQQPNPEQAQAMMEMYTKGFLDFLNQLSGLTINLDFDPAALDLGVVCGAKPESALAKTLGGSPVAMPDLASFLPKDAVFRGQFSVGNMQTLMKLYFDYFKSSLGTKYPDLIKEMEGFIEDSAKIGRVDMAASFGLSPDKGLQYQVIARADNPEAMMDLQQRNYKMMSDPAWRDFFTSSGIQFSMTEKKDARKIQGWPVDQYEMSMKPTETMPAEARAMFEKMFSKGLTLEICRLDTLVLVTCGESMDDLAARIVNKSPGDPLRSTIDFPAGGFFYGDVDVLGYLNIIRAVLPQGAEFPLPQISEKLAPLMFFAYKGDGAAMGRLRIPKSLVEGIAKAAKGQATGTESTMPTTGTTTRQ